jgi:hypothetical protein
MIEERRSGVLKFFGKGRSSRILVSIEHSELINIGSRAELQMK